MILGDNHMTFNRKIANYRDHRLKYNIWDTMAMNTMLSTCNTEGGCIPHITNMINSTTKAYKDKIIFLV